jgi:hypothetical protein
MTNDGLLAARAAYVKLETFYTVFEREIESGNGVFRCVEPCAAMSEQ